MNMEMEGSTNGGKKRKDHIQRDRAVGGNVLWEEGREREKMMRGETKRGCNP
jgi:hypothetical protein